GACSAAIPASGAKMADWWWLPAASLSLSGRPPGRRAAGCVGSTTYSSAGPDSSAGPRRMRATRTSIAGSRPIHAWRRACVNRPIPQRVGGYVETRPTDNGIAGWRESIETLTVLHSGNLEMGRGVRTLPFLAETPVRSPGDTRSVVGDTTPVGSRVTEDREPTTVIGHDTDGYRLPA